MKLIFSRKGIDDKYGKGFSPIFPNGEILSIPIPTKGEQGIPYDEIRFRNMPLSKTIEELDMRLNIGDSSHLDPDINFSARPRPNNWKGCFGQAGSAMKQLVNKKIEKGDIFLFFGSFRNLFKNSKGQYEFEPQHTKHTLFGYLEVGDIFINEQIKQQEIYKIYSEHPHVMNDYNNQNIIFVASDKFKSTNLSGSGMFKYHENLDLTKKGFRKSVWELPDFFHYESGVQISYHKCKSRYRRLKSTILLQTVAIGQDFVVEGNNRIEKWAEDLISKYVV